MTKAEAIAWLEIMKEDAIFEQNDALKMAIEALQTAEINCVHCPRYHETEDNIGVHSHCGIHGRLIDADALIEDLQHDIQNDENMLDDQATEDKEQIQFDKDCKQNAVDLLENAPTVQVDRLHGEWICKGDYAICSKCSGSSGTQFDGVERTPRTTAFCPHCGRRMKVSEDTTKESEEIECVYQKF